MFLDIGVVFVVGVLSVGSEGRLYTCMRVVDFVGKHTGELLGIADSPFQAILPWSLPELVITDILIVPIQEKK